MKTEPSTIVKTEFLKGIAIISVLMNHYANFFISGNYEEFANGMISIFFLLSGYGIFHSLSHKKYYDISFLKYFYTKRIFRIYPLYFLSLFLSTVVIGNSYSFFTYLAFPFQAPGIYWFITSLIQCYIFAPVIVFFRNVLGNKTYIIVLSTIMLLVHFISVILGFDTSRENFGYRFFTMGHLFLFCYGVCIPKISSSGMIAKKSSLILSGVVFAIRLVLTRNNNILFQNSAMYLSLIFMMSCFIFIASILQQKKFSLNNYIINVIGRYSYSIYLFHSVYYYLLYKLGFIQKNSLLSIILTLGIFPIFLVSCIVVENGTSSCIKRAKTYLTRTYTRPQ
jgi:peptidoglycan/LPS O-acetylase OafA/YrhL